jgi:hypothetical protein
MLMKTKIAALLLAAAALLTNACEQHKWSETKKLFEEKEASHNEGANVEHMDAKKENKAEEHKSESKKD